MCTSTAIWAKMWGIVFGAHLTDQTARAHQRIPIPAADIIKKSEPTLKIYAGFLREQCLSLLN
jgi:tRNA(Arg) A34 adenosine deaminase TadA